MDEKAFFEILHLGFAHKRKVLRKNLESSEVGLHYIDKIFEKLKINSKARAEDVNFEKWIEIYKYLSTDI